MEDIPLPGLTPGDPRNRLPVEARRRVQRAHIEADRIRWEAQANVEARQLTGSKEKYVLNQADLKAVRTILKVLSKEYDDAGLTLREFRDAMKSEIEGGSYSLGLYGTQTRLLEVEFSEPERKAKPVEMFTADTRPLHIQLAELREECRLTVDELAESIGVEPRSVHRHLSGTIPRKKQLRAYEQVFSKRLKRQVRLRETSVKRQ